MVVVLLHTLPPSHISSLKKYFSVEEAKAAAKEEGIPLEKVRVGSKTLGDLTVTSRQATYAIAHDLFAERLPKGEREGISIRRFGSRA